MPKYQVTLCCTFTVDYEVEAENEQSAIDMAKGRNDLETHAETMEHSREFEVIDFSAEEIPLEYDISRKGESNA